MLVNHGPGVYGEYDPLDADMLFIQRHPALVAWTSGRAPVLRWLHDAWHDHAVPGRFYTAGVGAIPPSPVFGAARRGAIRCQGGGVRCDTVTLPPSLTILAVASAALGLGTAAVVGGRSNTTNRVTLGVATTGAAAFTATTDNMSYTPRPVVAGAPFLIGCDFAAETKRARLYLDGVEPVAQADFAQSLPQEAGIGLGQTWGGAFPLTGAVSEFLLFDAPLEPADRARIMGYLARSYGLPVSGLI